MPSKFDNLKTNSIVNATTVRVTDVIMGGVYMSMTTISRRIALVSKSRELKVIVTTGNISFCGSKVISQEMSL